MSAAGPAAQSGLLHFLDCGEIITAGGVQPLRVDVRVIAASHHDLARAVADGRFNSELYYQLQVVPLTVPLRERPRDIAVLAEQFLAGIAVQHDATPVKLAETPSARWPPYPGPVMCANCAIQ